MVDFWTRLRDFDAYPKVAQDFRQKTFSGAAVSIVAGILMLSLFALELNYYLKTDVNHQLYVDTSRTEKMRINVDIVFPKMPCAYLSIDVMDISGEQQLDVVHNLYKRRLDENGVPVSERRPDAVEAAELGDKAEAEKPEALETVELAPDRCESCYGAETEALKCCNSCADVREAYRLKGWAFNNPKGIVQCEREGFSDKMAEQANEGCSVYGYLLVNKVAGNFHFAPGKSFQQHHVHVHDLQPFGRSAFNLTHHIRRLSFGHDYPGLVNPLDDHNEIATFEGSTMYQYFVKVVPTRYQSVYGETVNTNQYSVTTHQRHINHALGEHGLPGVFFMFEISPILVEVAEQTRSFVHFLTGVCAIVGGIFTVAGMIDSVVYHSLRSIQKKNQMGKLG